MKLVSPIIQKKAQQPVSKIQVNQNNKIVGFSFLKVCQNWKEIENTSKRLEKLEHFAKLLITMHNEYKDDIQNLLLLISNNIRQPWDSQKSVLNVGEMTVRKAMQQSFGVTQTQIKQDYQKEGDLGTLCMSYKQRQPKAFTIPKQLTIQYVLTHFQLIGDTEGGNATQDRINNIHQLFINCSALECKYIVRLLMGKNRLGIQRKTILFALSEYICYLQLINSKKLLHYDQSTNMQEYVKTCWQSISELQVTNRLIDSLDNQDEESDDEVQNSKQYNENDNIDEILNQIQNNVQQIEGNLRVASYLLVSKAFARVPSLTHIAINASNLQNVQVTPNIPILPMLAKPTASFKEILEKIDGKFACEYKYDGFRAQVHFSNGQLRIFSRSQEDMSGRFPDVLEQIKNAYILNNIDFIIDGEIVPVDDEGQILPFQMLSRRLKVYDQKQQASKITMFIFDIMFLRDKCLMDLEFQQRRHILHKSFQQNTLVQFAQSVNINNEDQLMVVLDQAVAHKTEGLIVKSLNSRYCPDRRSRHWLKLKKDYLEGIGDSLDLVPIAAWYGHGKRTGVVGAYLLAARNGDRFETVTRIGTGFSDQFLQQMTEYFADKKLEVKPKNYSVAESYLLADKPDFWISSDDSVVWEIKVANLSLSLDHTCAISQINQGERGVAARLPRLVRPRDDKSVEDCCTSQFILQRFNEQPDRQEQNAKPGDMDECGNDESSADIDEDEKEE